MDFSFVLNFKYIKQHPIYCFLNYFLFCKKKLIIFIYLTDYCKNIAFTNRLFIIFNNNTTNHVK